MAAVFVTPRTVQEQIADRAQFQALQLGGTFRPNPGDFAERRLQRILRNRHNEVINDATLNFKP
jgi:hypothetical protein